MTTSTTTIRPAHPPQVTRQIASFRCDPPIHGRFPLTLINGAVVKGLEARCANCSQTIDPEYVHGRVLDSLPTVKTLDVNAYCVPCERLIHIDGRFRAVDDTYQFEYPNERGQWRILRNEPETPVRKLQRAGKMLLAKASSLFRAGNE